MDLAFWVLLPLFALILAGIILSAQRREAEGATPRGEGPRGGMPGEPGWERFAAEHGAELDRGLLAIEAIRGRWSGRPFQIQVERRMDSPSIVRRTPPPVPACVVVATHLSRGLGLGLEIEPRWGGRSSSHDPDVGLQTGDAAFDATFVVRARDSTGALRLLNAELRGALLAWVKHPEVQTALRVHDIERRWLCLSDAGVEWLMPEPPMQQLPAFPLSPEQAAVLLDLQAALLHAVEQADAARILAEVRVEEPASRG